MGVRSIKMPDVGEGVAEAEIVEWAVKVGDLVREDQVVASVMTDKATVEIPTPVAGSVLALGGAVGDVLAVGAELIRIDAPGLPDSVPPAAKSAPQKPEPGPTPAAKSEVGAQAPPAAVE
ncbi:MAG: 2-oxo acid dehydrogenase subunit E2, partial [Hyphomicrobiales bacterium]|nr:2-oxo acid dehydrogenase subunit E2 [Hyphomicrobiales bacterium]